ncbi:MAG TPA: hypothetical protein VIX89_20065, partial [Bryobacteraceae bacterium]
PSMLDRLRSGIPDVRTIDQNTEELLDIYSHLTRGARIVQRPPSLPRATLWWGSLVRSVKLGVFGAQFGDDLALLRSQIKFSGERELAFNFQWHSPRVSPQWMVFIHFLDDDGATQIQADHKLWQYDQDPWGFVTYGFKIWIAEPHRGKSYRVRLGVWNPEEKTRLPVTAGRRLTIDNRECAVSLGVVRMKE